MKTKTPLVGMLWVGIVAMTILLLGTIDYLDDIRLSLRLLSGR